MLNEHWFPASESKNVVGRFVDVPVVHAAESRERGEEVVIYRAGLQSKVVGSHDVSMQVVKPFNAKALQQRFPGAWEHYEKQKAVAKPVVEDDAPQLPMSISGTPLHKADFLPKDRVPWLHMQGIQTLEQLAGLSDGVVQNLGRDVTRWRKQADAFLKRT